jgi:hypothetical protein
VIRYSYLSQIQPPAPFVYVTLRNPVTGAEEKNVPAQLDSAGDRTLLPASVVQSLSLPQIGSILIGGAGGLTQAMPSYPVEIVIHNLPSMTMELVASPGENWILLGRDVLNKFVVMLDGPQLALEIR